MRALIAARYKFAYGAHPYGGVQTWGKTVGDELERRGFSVEFYEQGDPEPKGEFLLGIMANACDTMGAVLGRCDHVLGVSHGIIEPEKPIPGTPYVFTSEEIRDYWGSRERITGPVIRQPIDLDFWRPFDEVTPRKHFVRFSYRHGLPEARQAAEALEMPFFHFHRGDPSAVRDCLRKAGVVLATGRAALEAMACGTPAIG